MRNSRDTKAGVAADWARLPSHLTQALSGLTVESQEQLGIGRRWTLQWEGWQLQLDAYVHRRDEGARLSPSRMGGQRSPERLGDLLVEFDFKPDLLWEFKNVTLDLRPLSEDFSDEPVSPGRERLLQLAKAVQTFLEASVVGDLDAVTPRLEFQRPMEETVLVGTPFRLPYQAVNAALEERHLEIQGENFEGATWLASEFRATPLYAGPVQLWLSLQNTRNLLRSAYTELTLQAVREPGRPPLNVQARSLPEACLEEGPALRLRLESDRQSSQSTQVFFIALDAQRSVALQFGGPRFSNAPPGLTMRLQKALLRDGTRPWVALGSSELHIEQRYFPNIRGTISWGSEDWVITAVSAGVPSDGIWREELRRRGVDVVA
jgi:hypothetical protein